MREVGFFIDREGKISRFGKAALPGEKRTKREQFHEESFYDDIENTEYFKSLQLRYNSKVALYGKAILFSLQGMIIGFQDRGTLVIYVPVDPNNAQKFGLLTLYDDLCGFDNYEVGIYRDLNDYSTYNDLNVFYQDYGILELQNAVVDEGSKGKN